MNAKITQKCPRTFRIWRSSRLDWLGSVKNRKNGDLFFCFLPLETGLTGEVMVKVMRGVIVTFSGFPKKSQFVIFWGFGGLGGNCALFGF